MTRTPLTELWNDDGPVEAKRMRQVMAHDVKPILNDVTFVVADVGHKLNWITPPGTVEFWKADLKNHFWEPSDKLELGQVSDGYAYLATEWIEKLERKIILLEKYH